MQAAPHVVVVGAGTLGLCTAWALSERGARVTVLDAHAIASGSSGRSVGVVGTQLTDPFDILLRAHAVRQFRQWENQGLAFHHIGYLRLARTAQHMALFAESVQHQQALGLRSRLYGARELRQFVPHLYVEDLEGGLFGPDDGFLDPHAMCMFLAEKVRAHGGAVLQFRTLVGATRHHDGYRLATRKGGIEAEAIECDAVVNAAGAWAPAVARMFGQTLHLCPERHEAICIHLDAPLDYTMPMVMDLVCGEGTGLNFRREAANALIAEIHKGDTASAEDPDHYNDQCDEASKVKLAELLLERLPDLPGARLGRGWAGLYPVTADQRPFVGCIDPAQSRLITAAGAGGYGIQLAPVIGTIAADWVLHGASVTIPGADVLSPTADRNSPVKRRGTMTST